MDPKESPLTTHSLLSTGQSVGVAHSQVKRHSGSLGTLGTRKKGKHMTSCTINPSWDSTCEFGFISSEIVLSPSRSSPSPNVARSPNETLRSGQTVRWSMPGTIHYLQYIYI